MSANANQKPQDEAQRKAGLVCTDLLGHTVKLTELLESAIMDFEKLKPWLGDAAHATAELYRKELEKIKCSLN